MLAALLGVVVSHTALMLTYTLQFAIMLSITTNLVQYLWRKGHSRRGSHMRKYGAAYMMAIAMVLLLASPLKNLMVNLCMQSFKEHGYEDTIGTILDLTTSSAVSTANMQKATVLGYVFLTLATAQSMETGYW